MHSANAIFNSVFEDTAYKNARAVDGNRKRCGLKKKYLMSVFEDTTKM